MIWLIYFIHFCDIDIESTHERHYAMCIKWTKLFEKENHSSTTQWLHVVETIMLKLCIQLWIYSFYSACDTQVNSYCVPVLFLCNASSLLCSSLMIFYTMMFWSLIAKIMILCTHDAHDCNVIVIVTHTPLWHRFRPDSWGTLCYLYRVDKTLWGRKPLAVYTAASRSRNNEIDTVLPSNEPIASIQRVTLE